MAKVFIGLSGGVDSAIALYLLKQQGHQVVAGFMRNWDSMANNDFLGNPDLQLDACRQEMDYDDAKKVADLLGVELIRIDFIKEYWDDVFNVFLEETRMNLTPNPDILCNKYIKFDAFFNYAMNHDFDYVATGHYAKLVNHAGMNYLYKADDLNKDQSYFLAQVSQQALQKTLFPLAKVKKEMVRDIALQLQLPIAKKKDSTGICFIGERHYREFVSNYIDEVAGDIIEVEANRVVARHRGVMFYTIGQRHGLNIDHFVGPYFVCGKDSANNRLFVTKDKKSPYILSDTIIVDRLNWYGEKINGPCCAKFRYRQADNDVVIKFNEDDTLTVMTEKPALAIALGQEAVFYQGDRVLGSGRMIQQKYQGYSFLERLKYDGKY